MRRRNAALTVGFLLFSASLVAISSATEEEKRTPQNCALAVKLEGSSELLGYARSVRTNTADREVFIDFMEDPIFCDGFD